MQSARTMRIISHISKFKNIVYLVACTTHCLASDGVASKFPHLFMKNSPRTFTNFRDVGNNFAVERSFTDIFELRGGDSDRNYGHEAGSQRGKSQSYYNNDFDSSRDSHFNPNYENDYNAGQRYSKNRNSDDYYDDNGERNIGEYPTNDRNYVNGDNYRDANYPYRSSSKPTTLSSLGNIPSIIRTGDKKIGMILLGGGAVFTMLGISLFFNKALMRLGNLLFIAGIPMTIGPGRTAGYFLQPKKARATGCIILGIFLVMVGWPIVGIVFEIFGMLNLFGNMFPMLMIILKQLPFVKSILGDGKTSSKSNKGYSTAYEYETSDRDEREDGHYNERERNESTSERYY